MINVGWLNTCDSVELQRSAIAPISPYAVFEPERYIRKPSGIKSRSLFTSCPAFVQFNRNLFLIRSPIDVDLEIKPDQNDRNVTNCFQIGDKVNPALLKSYITLEGDPNRQVDFGVPHIQFQTPYVFYADEPVTMMLFSPIHEHQNNIPGPIIPGEFDIHAWQRSVNWAMEWKDRMSPLHIKRGDPLFYVKFIVHRDPTLKVDLIRLKANSNTVNPVLRAQGAANLGLKTFDLFEIARKWRAKKFITKENIWTEGD